MYAEGIFKTYIMNGRVKESAIVLWIDTCDKMTELHTHTHTVPMSIPDFVVALQLYKM